MACPYGETYQTQPRGRMEIDLFRRIVDEAAEHDVHRISPYLMNEPLMDRDMFEKIQYINQKMPRCKVVVSFSRSSSGARVNSAMSLLSMQRPSGRYTCPKPSSFSSARVNVTASPPFITAPPSLSDSSRSA